MSQLAIFTAPKPFNNPHIRVIQRNAIRSWKALGNDVEVWLVGDEEGAAQTAAELGVGYIPEVERNSAGTPRIDSIFRLVREKSAAAYLCYVNADILLFPDFLQSLENVKQIYDRFLVIGQRWDATITDELDIKTGWHEEFVPRTLKTAKLHRAAGSDYFLFPRDEYDPIPAFAVGRAGWDNWMIYKGRVAHIPVIDATKSIRVIHQNHDFSHFANGRIHRYQPESIENMELGGGRHTVFTIHDSTHLLDDHGEVRRIRLNRWKLWREITILPSTLFRWPWLERTVYAWLHPERIEKDRRLAEEILQASEEKENETRTKSG